VRPSTARTAGGDDWGTLDTLALARFANGLAADALETGSQR
jgi:hypothetical protein